MSAGAGTGKTYKLGHPYTALTCHCLGHASSACASPAFRLAHSDGLGGNKVTWNDEFLATEIGQVGTQFDGLGHIGVTMGAAGRHERQYALVQRLHREPRLHNSVWSADKLGTEKLHPIIARGILIDIAAIWGKDMVAGDNIVTMEHVKKALDAQGMADFEFKPKGMPSSSAPDGNSTGVTQPPIMQRLRPVSAWKSPAGLQRTSRQA